MRVCVCQNIAITTENVRENYLAFEEIAMNLRISLGKIIFTILILPIHEQRFSSFLNSVLKIVFLLSFCSPLLSSTY